jgi:hypothetical protein
VRGATVDSTKVYMAFRYASDQSVDWMDLGLGLAGSNGVPNLRASGSMKAGTEVTLNLSSARPSSPGLHDHHYLAGRFPAQPLALSSGVARRRKREVRCVGQQRLLGVTR